MPDEPTKPSPFDPKDPKRHTGTSFAGETTRGTDSIIFPRETQPSVQTVGDFEIIGRLGQGGMGAVYRARQVSLNRLVALKILPNSLETDPEYVSRFQREARMAASMNHANLVKVYASGEADGCHYIAMELVEGETLGQWLKRGAMPSLEALRITLDVARALECGWRTAQLIHRDIKPGNIFLSVHGAVKLGDLGIAKIMGSDTTGLTQTGRALGTPHYISPEQARGDKDLDFRADIYSLGCTLYQMLTGHTPYSGTEPMVVMNQHLNAPPPAILKVMPQCPLPLARLVAKMMKKLRRERPGSYEELIAAIESVRAQLDPSLAAATMQPAPNAPPSPPPPTRAATAAAPTAKSPGKKPPLALYCGIAAAVVACAVAWLVWPKEEKLTVAQRWARDHAGEKREKAGPTTEHSSAKLRESPTSANHTAPSANPTETPSGARTDNASGWQPLFVWHDWIAETRQSGRHFDSSRISDDGTSVQVLNRSEFNVPGVRFRDGKVRATWTLPANPDTKINFRYQKDASGTVRYYAAALLRNELTIQWVETRREGAKYHQIQAWPVPSDVDLTKEIVLEVRALGDRFTLILNDLEIGTVQDTAIPDAGGIGLNAGQDTLVRKFEYQSSDSVDGGQVAAPAHP